MIPAFLNPKTVFVVLDEIDKQPPSFTRPPQEGAKRTVWILFSVCVSLLVLNYCKNSYVLEAWMRAAANWQGLDVNYYVNQLRGSQWNNLYRYAWWTGWHVVTYIFFPAIIIKCLLKQNIVDFGWRWGETHKHWAGYLYLLTPILCFVVMVSYRDDFVHHYPFYHEAGRSWIDFIIWEALYLTQFACLEFYYRGFIVQSLRPYYGSAAVWIMIVPYLMIHFPKPWLEATGAIFFGLFLGILALRSRSIWGGFCVHAGVAISMDVASLIQQGRIPNQWFPS